MGAGPACAQAGGGDAARVDATGDGFNLQVEPGAVPAGERAALIEKLHEAIRALG